ncbi:MAG: pantoate--beta-alanine ligase [Candidatus Pelagibacter bacterium]|jgi:pantoate--beta-alanine ligase|nr:pantoate--beta-alanine ligase [Candidatus Pelagibacter bacterium]|tara:strand:+ start:344 stop:1153 length:810 start_codon:yes stop_codon:yes gene_type:complete
MKIILSKKTLIQILKKEKDLGFVPTMGALHKAHIHIIKKSISQCKKTIVTIFINKQQFNEITDYKKYPRNIKKDISILRRCKIDYLYLPTTKQIYPFGYNKDIKISPFSKKLCGKSRHGHFKAVVDVVDRFIKIINPNKIFLGKKDMQQLKIIEEFIYKNQIKTKVVGCKTIREKNGVACSSRNFLLSANDFIIASRVYKLLHKSKKLLIMKKNVLKKIKNKISQFGIKKIDYIELLDINKQTIPFKKNKKYKLFIAYYLGSTRLIDNI